MVKNLLRLQYIFRSAIFFKFGFLLGQVEVKEWSLNSEKNLKRQNIGGEMAGLLFRQK